MIVPLLWFASGLLAGMYIDDIVDWVEDTVEELLPKEPVRKKRTAGFNFKLEVTDTEGNPVDFSSLDYNTLLKDSLKRVGLDTKLENLNKALGQISKAAAEAYDEAGKSGTVSFIKKYTRKEDDLRM
jgi:hypothetical protein